MVAWASSITTSSRTARLTGFALHLSVAPCQWNFPGPGAREGEIYVYTCPVQGDDAVDALRVEVDARTLAVTRKVFTQGGVSKETVTCDAPREFGAEWIPTRLHLEDALGYALDVAVSEYVPGFAFERHAL